MGFLDYTNPPSLLAMRLRSNDDFNILPEPREEAHETLAREAREPAVRGAENFGWSISISAAAAT